MYPTINGWTKESMKQAIQLRNTGCRAVTHRGMCTYVNDYGNHCAVGCFIPDEHPASGSEYGVSALISQFPELKFPLEVNALYKMQAVHDYCGDADPRPLLAEWIEMHVVDGGAS